MEVDVGLSWAWATGGPSPAAAACGGLGRQVTLVTLVTARPTSRQAALADCHLSPVVVEKENGKRKKKEEEKRGEKRGGKRR